MKKTLILLAILVLVPGVLFAGSLEVEKKVNDVTVKAVIDKDPPVVGKNGIKVELLDSAGQPITDAKVKIYYSMPAMPGMPAMDYKTGAEPDGKGYSAVMDLSMSGPWNVEVKFKRGDGPIEKIQFNVDAR